MKKNFVLFFILITISNLCSQNNQINPENFIKEVQTKYSALNSSVIEFVQEISSKAVEGKQKIAGKLFYQKKNRYRLELDGSLIVCDGETVHNYSRNAKRVVITKYEENFFSPQNLLVDIPNYSKIEFNGDELMDNKKIYKFSLTPTRSNPEFKSMILWIDENKTIWKIQTEDWAGNNYTFIIQKFEPNPDLKSELFKFKIPSGVKVIDLR